MRASDSYRFVSKETQRWWGGAWEGESEEALWKFITSGLGLAREYPYLRAWR